MGISINEVNGKNFLQEAIFHEVFKNVLYLSHYSSTATNLAHHALLWQGFKNMSEKFMQLSKYNRDIN
jgi:hypothetical protein